MPAGEKGGVREKVPDVTPEGYVEMGGKYT